MQKSERRVTGLREKVLRIHSTCARVKVKTIQLFPGKDIKTRPTATSGHGQLPHQDTANCHIKNRPTATFIVKKVAEFEI